MAGWDNEVSYGSNWDYRGVSPVVGQMTTNGQLMIGSTVAPNARVGTLTSSNGSVNFAYSAPTSETMQIDITTSPGADISLRPYIVGPTNSDYTTIQAAVTQAVIDGASATNQKNIYIKPQNGGYVENLTLADGINLVSFVSHFDAVDTSVVIDGLLTLTAGTAALKGLTVAPTSGNIFAMSGAGLEITDCFINATAGVVFDFSGTTTKQININDSYINGDATSQLYTHDGSTSATTIKSYRSFFQCSGLTTVSGAGGTYNIESKFDQWASRVSFDTAAVNFSIHFGVVNVTTGTLVTYSATTGGHINFFNCFENIAAGASLINCANAAVLITQAVNCTASNNGFLSPTYANGQGVQASFEQFTNTSPENSIISGFRWNSDRTGFRGSESYHVQEFLSTESDTAMTLAAITVAELESITVQGIIVGSTTDHTNSVGGDFLISARRATAGNITIVGTAVTNVNSSSAATFTADVDTATQTVRIRVTGVADTIYNWTCTINYQKLISSS